MMKEAGLLIYSGNRNVTFNGERLIFHVDNIRVENGKLPSIFEINGQYRIDSDSLIRLIGEFEDGVACKREVTKKYSFCDLSSERFYVYTKEEFDKLLMETLKEYQEYVEFHSTDQEVFAQKERHYQNAIKEHNSKPWYKRVMKLKI